MRSRIESIGISLPGNGLFKKGSVDHAVTAGRHCLEKSKYPASSVTTMINTGVYRDGHVIEPAIAAIVQDRLEINPGFHGKDTFSFDLMNSGCGLLNGIDVVTTMMKGNSAGVGMVFSSEANPDSNPTSDYSYERSGVALIIDRSPEFNTGFGEFIFRTFSEYADAYTGTVSMERKNGRISISKEENLEKIYLNCIQPVVTELLESELLDPEDIDLVIPSQISADFVKKIGPEIGIPESKVLDVHGKVGDTLTTSIMLGYDYALKKELIKPGMKVLMVGAGAGITIGATVYYC